MKRAAYLALLALVAMARPARAEAGVLPVGFLGEDSHPRPAIGRLDQPAREQGLLGARLGIEDSRTTGRFTGQEFRLVERLVPPGGDAAAAARSLASQGVRFVVADLGPSALTTAADAVKADGVTILNAGAPDDTLRGEACRGNVLHTLPSRAMLADGLAQYLVARGWKGWMLIFGPTPADEAYASAVRRAAAKFGAEISEEKPWTFRLGRGRSDSGHVTLQAEIPTFTRGAPHDVLVVADEEDAFGAYLEGRTALPRPVAGTHGLIATAWSPVFDQWGSAQLQVRFERAFARHMTARDYAAWVAVRSIAEAAVRTRSVDPGVVAAYLRAPDFLLAAFKGQGLGFRPWDGQLRQPILIAGPRLIASVSPQEGFLHPTSSLDTLGTDEGESTCRF
jgi:ABC transporter substrate binding protein (PQQ-dependent alcohol dehydrogenase system)